MTSGPRQCGCAWDKDGVPSILCGKHEKELHKGYQKVRAKVYGKIRRSNPSRRALSDRRFGAFKIGDSVRFRGYSAVGVITTLSPLVGVKWGGNHGTRHYAKDIEGELVKVLKQNPSRPSVGSPAYIKRASERPPRARPTKRLRKRRAKNRGRKVFPNPSGFIVRAQGRTGRPMYLTSKAGERPTISTDQAPRVFKTAHFALKVARALVNEFPMLSKYQVAVVDARQSHNRDTRPN